MTRKLKINNPNEFYSNIKCVTYAFDDLVKSINTSKTINDLFDKIDYGKQQFDEINIYDETYSITGEYLVVRFNWSKVKVNNDDVCNVDLYDFSFDYDIGY